MPVSAEEIQSIIEGKPVPIDFPCPWDADLKWYMRQPVDWVYDMAQAVKEAALAKVLAEPEIKAVKKLPPSDKWLKQQQDARDNTERRIKALEKKGDAITPEEALELENLKDYRDRLIEPTANFTRADEIAGRFATRAMETWMMPRLIVDANDRFLFDMEEEEGRERWERLDRETKALLRGPFYQVLLLVQTAKNSKAGQNSSSS